MVRPGITHAIVRVAALAAFALVLFGARTAHAGYTHYWQWKSPPDATALEFCLAEMNQLASARRDTLSDYEERKGDAAIFRGTASFGDAGVVPSIYFNGVGSQGHEPFDFPGAPEFAFTKTVYKPYDEVVTAALIVARDHFPPEVLGIHSDGQWDEWAKGAALYEDVLHRTAHNPMTPIEPPKRLAPGTLPALDMDMAMFDEGATLSPRRNKLISALFFTGLIAAIALWRRR